MTCIVEPTVLPFNGNICRLCIQSDETLWNIFETCDEDTNLNLPEKILSCLNIMVEVNDGLPDLVCGKCMTVVRCFYEYRQECLQHDIELRESLRSLCSHDSPKPSAGIAENLEQTDGEDFGPTDTDAQESTSLSESIASISKGEPAEKSLISYPSSMATTEIEPGKAGSQEMRSVDASIVLQLQEDWSEDEKPESCSQPPSKEKELPWRSTALIFKDDDDVKTNSSDAVKSFAKAGVSLDLFAGRISRTESGMWICNLCSQEYKILSTLKKHISWHYSLVTHQCPECQISLNSAEALNSHISQHRSSSLTLSHTCELCYKTFQLGHLLKKHIDLEHNTVSKRVTAPKKFRTTCGKCVKVFYCSSEMENHNESCGESMDGEGSEVDSSEDIFRTEQFQPKYKRSFWPCYLCNLIFNKVRQLTFHFEKEHAGQKPFKCDSIGCEKLFENNRLFSDHKFRDHRPGFPCIICKRVFKEKSKHNNHMRVHLGVKSYQCDLCDQSLLTSCDLRRHKKYHLKPLNCDDCGKGFGTKLDLARHKAQVHSLKKDFICEICGKEFAHPDNLGKHKKNNHTKIFKCKHCEEEILSSKVQFISHERMCNKEKFTCKFCNRHYTQKRALSTHMRTKHPKE